MQYGLSGETLRELRSIFLKYKNIQEVVIYESRAKGNYRAGSDIDLALKTVGDFGFTELIEIGNDFDDSDLPYFVDVLIYDAISNSELKAHIDRVGKVLYSF